MCVSVSMTQRFPPAQHAFLNLSPLQTSLLYRSFTTEPEVMNPYEGEQQTLLYMPRPSSVFIIPELLQMILLEASVQDILISHQRINKTFKGVIDSSPSIQRKLFYNIEFLSEDDHLATVQWNSFMKSFGTQHNLTNYIVCDPSAFEQHGYPSASWRNMSITYPPINTLMIKHYSLEVLYYLVSDSGITIGQLAETQQRGCYLRTDGMRGPMGRLATFEVDFIQRVGDRYLCNHMLMITSESKRRTRSQNEQDNDMARFMANSNPNYTSTHS